MSTYAEKAAFGSAVVPTTYAIQQSGYDASTDYYRQQQPTYVQTAYPQGPTYPTQGFTVAPYVMATPPNIYFFSVSQDNPAQMTFNPAAPPPPAPHNFSRPPPRKDEYPGGALIFDASLPSSAAYTASWVSSTSSIRPDLPEGPSVPQMVGDFGQWNNPDPSADSGVTSGASNPYATTLEQFGKMTVIEHQPYDPHPGAWVSADLPPHNSANLTNQQWPGLDQANERMNKDKKKEERERKLKEEPPAKDLTWEERLKRAQGAKERAENPRNDRREDPIRGARGGRGGTFRPTLPRGPRSSEERGQEGRFNGQRSGPMQNGEDTSGMGMRGGMRSGMVNRGGLTGMPTPPMQQNQLIYRGAPPPQNMMVPPPFIAPGQVPPMMPPQQPQDQKFRNSWLDENLFHPPFPYPMEYQMSGVMRGGQQRGRGRGGGPSRGRGGRRYGDREGEDGEHSEGRPDYDEPHPQVEIIENPPKDETIQIAQAEKPADGEKVE